MGDEKGDSLLISAFETNETRGASQCGLAICTKKYPKAKEEL